MIQYKHQPCQRLAKGGTEREAQELISADNLVVDVADPLEVIEQAMRYFYGLGVHCAKNKAPIKDVQKCFCKALHAASLAAPYRHPRLNAVSPTTATLHGICPDCNRMIYRRVNPRNLDTVRGELDVTITQARLRIQTC
jgi:hypothetical protein